jgi:CheY-like chemotaxis protein
MSSRVLIVDDEFGLAEVLAEMLAELGHEVDLAMNGQSALEHMAAARPDLVLADVMMPIMDGPALLHRIREDPATSEIPVVLMTAIPRSVPATVTGMHQGLLVKPFTPDELFAAIEPLLASRR